MDANALNVHDVSISEDVDMRPQSFGAQLTKVTFWVGMHGPFVNKYPKAQATDAVINRDIDAQVLTIRNITANR